MINISPLLDKCRAARVSQSGLAELAALRRVSGVRIVESAESAWIIWDGEMPSIVRALQAAPGVAFYAHDQGNWRTIDASLPDFTVPHDEKSMSLAQAVLPDFLAPAPTPEFSGARVNVTLVPCGQPRPTTALRCSADVLRRWCEHATAHEIGLLSGAICDGRVWLRGEELPVLLGAERFWGHLVLVPLGMRPEPDWPESPLRSAAFVDDEEILVLTPDGPEALPVPALRRLSRAAVRRRSF